MASNLPPGVTPNMVFGEPEGFTTVTEQLVLIGDDNLITLQVAEDGDFCGEKEFCIDLDPTTAYQMATIILKMCDGEFATTEETTIEEAMMLFG